MGPEQSIAPRGGMTAILREPGRFAARDRVLLYLRGLETDELASLELAAECLRRAGPDAGPRQAMRELRQLLREKAAANGDDVSAVPRRSYPPLNRQAMVSPGMECPTLLGCLVNCLRRLLGLENEQETFAKRSRA